MPFSAVPKGFFGPVYSAISGYVSIGTSEASATTGTTFQCTTPNELVFAAAHQLKVGDRIRLTQVTTLPTGLAAATDYYVATVPDSTTITLKDAPFGDPVTFSADGTADNTAAAYGPMEELVESEADPATGDWRKVVFALLEALYQRFLHTPVADRPSRVSISRSSVSNDDAGTITRTYVVQVTVNADAVSVAAE